MTEPKKNWLEWTVFAVGLALVLATLGFLVRESINGVDGPPEVVVRLGAPRPSASGYLVPVEVHNPGGATAEDVRVPIHLDLGGGRREEAELDIAYLPRGSRRNGWVSFREDPRRGRIGIGAIAFEVP
ncbi:hypothetical protein BH24GEM1_BH24GEM1_00430 [soil metagenome]|nr:hypothetical protein [Gemmatimonadales bacterium]